MEVPVEDKRKGLSSDNSLIEKAKHGHKEAFCDLIREQKVSMYSVARTILKNHEDIGDAISETILKAYKNIGELKEDSYFKTWLIRILINQCYEICRKNKRVVLLHKDNILENEEYIDNYENIDLRRALDTLEDELKILVVLYYYQDMSIQDIGETLDIPQGTVKSRLARARKRLYLILKEE